MQEYSGSRLKLIQLGGLEFYQVGLVFESGTQKDLFASKNNKTLQETLLSPRYRFLAAVVHARYPKAMAQPLGVFLLECKQAGDPIYKKFLNHYGDETYSRFYFQDAIWLYRKGLYCYMLGEAVVYIGQSRDSFGRRINQGYGNISPKNCYLDGQATNCHINALVTINRTGLALFLCEVVDLSTIDQFEKRLIQIYQPAWNIALKD